MPDAPIRLSVILTTATDVYATDSERGDPPVASLDAGTILRVWNPCYHDEDWWECVEPESGVIVWVRADDCEIWSDGAP